MQTALKMTTKVHTGGKVELVVPQLPVEEMIEVIILFPLVELSSPRSKRSVVDILAEAPGHRLFQTAGDVECYLHEEHGASFKGRFFDSFSLISAGQPPQTPEWLLAARFRDSGAMGICHLRAGDPDSCRHPRSSADLSGTHYPAGVGRVFSLYVSPVTWHFGAGSALCE